MKSIKNTFEYRVVYISQCRSLHLDSSFEGRISAHMFKIRQSSASDISQYILKLLSSSSDTCDGWIDPIQVRKVSLARCTFSESGGI